MRSGLAGALPAYTAAALASLSLSLSVATGEEEARGDGRLLLLGLRPAALGTGAPPLRRPASLPAPALPLAPGAPLLLLAALLAAPPLLLLAVLLAASPLPPPPLLPLLLLIAPLASPLPCMAWKAARARSHCPPRPSAEMRRL